MINVPKFHLSICCMFLCEMNAKSWIPPLQVSSLKPIVTYHRWLLLSTCTSTINVKLCIDYQRQLAYQLLASIYTLIIIIDCCCWLVHQLSTLICVLTVATLALGSWPRQGLAKVQAKREAQESHLMFLGV